MGASKLHLSSAKESWHDVHNARLRVIAGYGLLQIERISAL
jgi:hypothetical protein